APSTRPVSASNPPRAEAVLPANGAAAIISPLCPLCPLGRLFGPKEVIGPLASGPIAEPPSDHVTLTPGRVLAPVGSEVVLRAGVCGKDGYLHTNRKIEWMLGQEGAGQFAEVGEEGVHDFMRFPWSVPKKIDNHYAIGYTAPYSTCLRRGTVNPADDLQVQRGEAWITVTSASEGTSYITAYAPDGENWNTRRAQATIYWVDAQWQLPPPAVVAGGQQHVLTTTVTRQTDGAPLAGYIVRYEVVDATGAQLGYGGGQSAEVTTDSRGQASVEVTPTDSNPGTSRVRVTIARPEQAGVAASPRIDIGGGETQVTWSNTAAGTQPLFPPVEPQPAPPTAPPTTPPVTPPPSRPNEPPVGINEPTGRPDLQLSLEKQTPDPIKVSDRVTYNIKIWNLGNGVARNVVLFDRFDDGLTSPYDVLGNNEIKNENLADIGPNQQREVLVEFDVLSAGDHWHEVTVTADGATEAFNRATFTAEDDKPAPPSVTLKSDIAPVRTSVGRELVVFSAVVENTGATVAENLRFSIYADSQLEIDQGVKGSQATTDGGFAYLIPALQPGEKKEIRYTYKTLRATEVGKHAQVRAFLQSDSGVNEARQHEVEILVAAGAPLSLSVTSNTNPVRRGQPASLVVTLSNTSQQALRNVQLQIAIPQGVTFRPEVAQTPGGLPLQASQTQLTLTQPIPQIGPNDTQRIVVPFEVSQQGDVTILTRAAWEGAANWLPSQTVVSVQP
ncbi:MAG: hypothetical protein KDA37_10180, partial [Planctomycetales bacterium]|nr:hypothetical protein [Planctomycetales bacterium]